MRHSCPPLIPLLSPPSAFLKVGGGCHNLLRETGKHGSHAGADAGVFCVPLLFHSVFVDILLAGVGKHGVGKTKKIELNLALLLNSLKR